MPDKSPFIVRFSTFCILAALAWLPSAIVAQEHQSPSTQALPTPAPLDSLPASDSNRLVLDASNVAPFRQYLTPELYDAVIKGAFEIPTARQGKTSWSYDNSWMKESAEVLPSTALDDEIWKSSVEERKFPYGLGVSGGLEGGQALKLLWNTESLWRAQGALSSRLRLTSYADGKIVRTFSAEFARVYPHRLTTSVPPTQIFREILRFRSPAPVEGLAYLSMRSLGPDEDALWIYSPHLKKTRQLVGSNRSDSVLNTLFTLDDLLVWSAKNEFVKPTGLKSLLALVPTPIGEVEALNSPESEKCFLITSGSSGTSEGSSAGSPEPRPAMAQIPSSVAFVPRPVWVLELSPSDPFGVSGRIEVTIDKDMMLPVAKRVFDQSGKPLRTVIGIFGLAVRPDGIKVPYPRLQVFVSPDADRYATLAFDDTQVCDEFSPQYPLTVFDPSRL